MTAGGRQRIQVQKEIVTHRRFSNREGQCRISHPKRDGHAESRERVWLHPQKREGPAGANSQVSVE